MKVVDWYTGRGEETGVSGRGWCSELPVLPFILGLLTFGLTHISFYFDFDIMTEPFIFYSSWDLYTCKYMCMYSALSQ